MKIGLVFQERNFIGPEYYRFLTAAGYELIPIRWGTMSHFSVGWEKERTGGLWTAKMIPEVPQDVSEWGGNLIGGFSEYDVLINGGVGRKLGKEILNAPRWGWVNVHPGSLPDFRGSSCPEWAKLLGKPVVCTAHKMVEELDAGPVIHASEYVHPPEYNYHQFRAHLYPHCAVVLMQALNKIEKGESPTPQTEGGATWPPMPREVIEIVKRRFFPFHPGVM